MSAQGLTIDDAVERARDAIARALLPDAVHELVQPVWALQLKVELWADRAQKGAQLPLNPEISTLERISGRLAETASQLQELSRSETWAQPRREGARTIVDEVLALQRRRLRDVEMELDIAELGASATGESMPLALHCLLSYALQSLADSPQRGIFLRVAPGPLAEVRTSAIRVGAEPPEPALADSVRAALQQLADQAGGRFEWSVDADRRLHARLCLGPAD